ncbi:MAG: hypothetical protein H0V95_05795 [Actinobacteria bacterium]|nr:hypothetical protein [Actinomycetota bacterium]
MSNVEISDLEPEYYAVRVTEGGTTTTHRVRLAADELGDLGFGDMEPERLLRETFTFLLERESASEIMEEFELDDITRFFPDFYNELRNRLGE